TNGAPSPNGDKRCTVTKRRQTVHRHQTATNGPPSPNGDKRPAVTKWRQTVHRHQTGPSDHPRLGADCSAPAGVAGAAGHPTPILTMRYAPPRLHDLAGGVEKLATFLPAVTPAHKVQMLRANGKDSARAWNGAKMS